MARAQCFSTEVIEDHYIAPDLVFILQEKTPGKVLQVHDRGIGGLLSVASGAGEFIVAVVMG